MKNSNTDLRHPGKFLLQKYWVGELDKETSSLYDEHIEQCPQCKETVDHLKRQQQNFHRRYPYGVFHSATVEKKESWTKKAIGAVLAPAMRPVFSMMLLLFLATPVIIYYQYSRGPDIRMKGEESLSFLLRRNETIRKGDVSETFLAGDEIQIVYTATAAPYIALFSVDEAGTVSLYHPDLTCKWCSIPAEKGAQKYYPTSIVLDESSGQELIVALFTKKPLEVNNLNKSLSKYVHKKPVDLGLLKKNLELQKVISQATVKTITLTKQ